MPREAQRSGVKRPANVQTKSLKDAYSTRKHDTHTRLTLEDSTSTKILSPLRRVPNKASFANQALAHYHQQELQQLSQSPSCDINVKLLTIPYL